ncbi:hypothetical protein BDM02DRAFT_3105170, partial [Thelephora ganbajun]
CPPEWVTWLQDSFMVPSCLVPHRGNDAFPDGTQNTSMRLFGPEIVTDALFQDDSCSTITHDLLCVGGEDTGKYWFMTAAEDWLEVTEHLRARNGSNTIRLWSMSLQELSQAPFDVYFYTQKKGDLVILPSRSFSQTVHRGITASLCWERMTLQGLEMFVYHDRFFKQRYVDYRSVFCG